MPGLQDKNTSEEKEIKTGDVVCLNHQKDDRTVRKFTVGDNPIGKKFSIHWFHDGELKTAQVHKDALHKLEE